jgi:hypothetical protein
MPKVQILQQETSVNNLGPTPSARGERVTSAIGEMAPALQRGLGEIQQGIDMSRSADIVEARVLKQQAENDAAVWSGKVLSDAHIQWQDQLLKSQETAGADAAGFTPKFLTEFDKYSEETLKNAPTESAKKYLGDRLTSMRTSLAGQALTFEASTRRANRINTTTQTIDQNAKSAQDNPDNFATLYAESKATIDALEIPPSEKLQLLDKLRTTLPYAAELGRIQRDPRGEAARLRSGIKMGEASTEYGNRPDGTPKGRGFLGPLKRPDGDVMTEYSVGVEIDGKEMDIPTIVPTLTKDEVQKLLTLGKDEKIPESIIDKAVAHAKMRLKDGKPVFATDTEAPAPKSQTAGASFDSIMDFVFKKEGGYNANDGNGPVNFGINQAANPGVDVKSLTKDGAKTIYRQKYWAAIDGDSLPPGVALMAMEAAVNQGPEFAKKILRESGGDIQKMSDMRRAHYQSLVERNPGKYGKYANNWNSRLNDATATALSMGGSGVGSHDVSNIKPENVAATGDPAIDALPFNQRIQLLQHADTLVNQQMAMAREQLKSKLQDFQAMATTGAPLPATSVPTVQELQAAHGDVEGQRMYDDDVKPLVELNGDLQRFSTMSVGERQALLTSRAPQSGDGFADAQRRYGVMVQADQMLTKQMTEDPAAYTMKYAQPVTQAWTTLQQTPSTDMAAKSAAASAYVAATLSEQKRVGVLSPTILPKNVADGIVRQFYDQANGGQNAALLMQQQAQLWGKHWPQVYGQVAKDLPGAALVIGAGMKQQPAELLARASVMKPDEIKEGLPKDSIKTAEEGVQSAMVDFQSSLAQMAGGAQTFNTFYEQTNKLALMYVRMGEDPGKAAKRAFNDTVGEKYEFVTDSNNKAATYRVPVQFDAGVIEKGAIKTLRNIESMDLQVPVSLAGLPEAEARKAYVSSLKDSAYWVTAPDESGLVLYANGAAVTDKAGRPVLKDWDSLQSQPLPSQSQSGTIRRTR